MEAIPITTAEENASDRLCRLKQEEKWINAKNENSRDPPDISRRASENPIPMLMPPQASF